MEKGEIRVWIDVAYYPETVKAIRAAEAASKSGA